MKVTLEQFKELSQKEQEFIIEHGAENCERVQFVSYDKIMEWCDDLRNDMTQAQLEKFAKKFADEETIVYERATSYHGGLCKDIVCGDEDEIDFSAMIFRYIKTI